MSKDMPLKISLQWLWFIGSAVAVAFCTIIILLPDDFAQKSFLPELASSGFPIRLTVPAIRVDAVIEPVGLTPEGTMDVPKGPADVAWFSRGTRPGQSGSAVIAGHSGWKDDIPAAFDHLNQLKKGDKIYIEDEKGAVSVFVVRETRTYDPKADASSIFGSSDGKAHLNLITCAGTWDSVSKSSSERLVVFTDKE